MKKRRAKSKSKRVPKQTKRAKTRTTTTHCRRVEQLRGLGEVSKKDFIAIGNLLCHHRVSGHLIIDLADYFQSQNRAFDKGRFVDHVKKCMR